MAQFELALKKLVDDANYRNAVSKDFHRLTADFGQLEAQEMLLLMQVWLASGRPDAVAFLSINLCHCCCGVS
jgi:hypothetical protein